MQLNVDITVNTLFLMYPMLLRDSASANNGHQYNILCYLLTLSRQTVVGNWMSSVQICCVNFQMFGKYLNETGGENALELNVPCLQLSSVCPGCYRSGYYV